MKQKLGEIAVLTRTWVLKDKSFLGKRNEGKDNWVALYIEDMKKIALRGKK